MKKLMCVLLIGVIFIAGTGCAGSDPNPIAVYLPGDENKSCTALKAEIANIDKQITRKQQQKYQAYPWMPSAAHQHWADERSSRCSKMPKARPALSILSRYMT